MDSSRTIEKKVEISLLDIARKNELFLQYQTRKLIVFFFNCFRMVTANEILFSDQWLFFHII